MSQPSILGRWYADPLPPDEARKLLATSEERARKRKRHCGGTLSCNMQKMIAEFWLGKDIGDSYQMLKPASKRSAHGRALLELIYGQLLLSLHLNEGLLHLERGFRMAANLFAAGDYLEVMNRHRLLRQLPLTDTHGHGHGHAETLEAMLTSAKVIERMKQSEKTRKPYLHDPKDTYG